MLYFPLNCCAQIIGLIIRKETDKPLAGATVSILMDKAGGAKTFSGDDGTFMLLMPPPGKYQVSVSFIGCATRTIPVEILAETKKISLPAIELQSAAIHLSRVEVKTSRALIKVRRDTLEFSAGDYPTAENASLRNLLEKMPGFFIDTNGDLFFQGKRISEINIDGRRVVVSSVSGTEKNSIIQQLLAGAADKIQIMSKEKLNGFGVPSGDEKILNITIRKEMKKGINGTLSAAQGTGGRYNASGNANMFREDKQIMVSGSGNNTNSNRGASGSDEQEYMNEGLGGINEPLRFSSSFSFDPTKKTRLSANYFHQTGNLTNDLFSRRDNLLADSGNSYSSETYRSNHVIGDNVFANADFQFDDYNKLSVGANGMLMNHDGRSYGGYLTTGKENDTINYGRSDNTGRQELRSLNVNGNYNHRFKNEKSQLTFFWNLGGNSRRDDQDNFNLNATAAASRDTIHRKVSTLTQEFRWNLNASFSRLIAKGLYISADYNFTSNSTGSLQRTRNPDHGKPGAFLVDTALSYDFKNVSTIHILTAALNFQKEKLDGSLSVSFNQNNSSGVLLSSRLSYRQNIRYWAPSFDINYHFSEEKTLSLRLSSRPGLIDRTRSLLPVISAQNPLYVELGNPDLKPSVDRNMTVEYNLRKPSGFTFSMNLEATTQSEGISAAVYSDSIGRQISKPVNVDGNFHLHSIIDIARRFNALEITLKYNSFSAFSRSTNLINGSENRTANFRTDHTISLSRMYRKLAEVTLSTNLKYFGNDYSLRQRSYTDFILYKTYLGLNVFLPSDLNLGGAAIYTQNTSQDQRYILVNSWIAKTFLPSKSLMLKLYAYDLFRQNKSLLTLPSQTFIESSRSSVVERYFMLSVTCFFGKK
jgi:hypothetical protein